MSKKQYNFMDKPSAASAALAATMGVTEADVEETTSLISTEADAMKAVSTLMNFIGADLDDPNCVDTPKRVMKAWRDYWGVGYRQNASDFLTVFPNEDRYDEMVIVENIPVHSTCSHHLAPITGYACVAIIPDRDLIGLSKYARVVDMFARRLQLQERLTVQIADEIDKLLKPLGVAVFIRASHGCMSSRGVKIHESTTTTSTLRGAFRANDATRAEFMSIASQTRGL